MNHTCRDIDECESKHPPMCSQVCQNFPGSYKCSCHHGYVLEEGGKCRVNGSPPIFLLAHDGEIRGYEMYQNRSLASSADYTHLYVKDQDKIKRMALGPNQLLYFSDAGHKKVYSSHLEGEWKVHSQEVINVGLSDPEGIDVDWSTGHLYVADSGRGEILACLGNGDMCTTVVSHLHHPRALVIDQRHRQLFWSDVGEPAVIARAGLDGGGRIAFMSDHVGYINVMVLDQTTDCLYWVDNLFLKLESVRLDGSDRKILMSYSSQPFSIAVFEDRIYWTDLNQHGLFSANKFTGLEIQNEVSEIFGHVSLIVMHPILQIPESINNPCVGAKCSHMCLPTVEEHRCMCPQDMHLENNMTCKISQQVPRIYLGAKQEILQFPLFSVGYQDYQVRTVIAGSMKNIPSMSVSQRQQTLVFSDIRHDVIARVNIFNESRLPSESIVYSKNLQSVEKLEVDPVTGNIFWIDVRKKTVEVASLNGNYHTVLISSDQIIQRLTSIAIDVTNGVMYLSLVGVNPTILRCFLDGSSCQPLAVKVYHPNDLVLYEGRLYIADGNDGMVQIISIDVYGLSRFYWSTLHWQGNGRMLKRMAIYGNTIYWTEDKETSLFSVDVQNSDEENIVLHDTPPLMSITISSPDETVETACSINNGGCSHLCLPVSGGSRVCRCSDGYLIQTDNTSCAMCKEPSCQCEAHRICSSTTECDGFVCDEGHCLPADVICDGATDCEDMSDEEESRCSDATPKDCEIGSFECDSGECVAEHLVCNGFSDCTDASDEGWHCESACISHHCQHQCVALPSGGVCRCRPGYQIYKDGKSCIDVDECEENNGGCSQQCVNTEGDRECHCSPEFISNITSCVPPDPKPYFLFLEQGSLTRYDLNSGGDYVTIGFPDTFLAFDVVMSSGDIIGITSTNPETLVRTNQIDQRKEVLLSMLRRVVNVAYDWLGKNLYLSDIAKPALIVCPIDLMKDGCLSLLHEKTGSVALHPMKGLLFWLGDDSIQMSTMSGHKRRRIVEFDFALMSSSLVLDQFSDRLYWIDHMQGVIESCNTDGSYRRIILSQHSQGIYMSFLSVNVFGDHLYFTDEKTQSLYRYNRLTGHKTVLTQHLYFSLQVKVIQPLLQSPGSKSTVCAQKSCSHLCLLSPEGAACACPDGWDIINNKTCISPHMALSATLKTTEGSPRASTSPIPPRASSSPIPTSQCNLLCLNGGTCSYSQVNNMDYCICTPGHIGTYCNEKEPVEDITPGPREDSPAVIGGILLGSLFTTILIISCLCYLKHKRDNIDSSEIIHFRPLFLKRNCEDVEELLGEPPARTAPRNLDVDQQDETLSASNMEGHCRLSWQYSSSSVDSAFVSHIDENDNLTSQLLPSSQGM
ncbi:low-density lipoprotein receptor-related protein 2-like isoform X2 [Ostrea edulis]|uniref:low-density lipoprotein receptor-related protein 2-like isoform X2 n=1 Tax=Ostrea edulis TaxID=37623 RepID=UPI0024AE9E6F|nr:low-density lipoprotein receptor-related protein 2-like isoform X2 [Ostrea edulis]XP_056011719.1 low-density lipoprotein receptor-related protein 2-like isoform X2 [Ostrea edulis]XP_056011720.1 low-density lipoprotein receptor-related protein 2-like isoform X2 [Ostrea edulis]XP_056011721.1 low-density lipoprotein receptor-related protein 2-like isoform X2 [Ostrea edulis]XP_056011722.1 low-density lipoprotein receptor-related protein 2-like isoform X2 [Ostrea edulis]